MACALVATWWAGPSQKRLFSSALVLDSNHQRWMNGVVLTGSNAHLLGYVRSLRYCRGVYAGVKYRMRNLQQDHGEYFSALCNLHSLTLFNIVIEPIVEEEFRTCFSAFRETLTCLTLQNFAVQFSAFVTLVDYFPNIRNLRLRSFTPELDAGPIPTLSRPLRGRVDIRGVDRCSNFLDQFARLDLEYEEVVIGSPLRSMGTKYLEHALRLSVTTVKILRLAVGLPCE